MEKKRPLSIRRIQSTLHEIQAMTRNPEYREDYFLWKEKKKHGLEIMLKYGIAFVVDPDFPLFKTPAWDWDDLSAEMKEYIQDEFQCFFIREWVSNSVSIIGPPHKDWITQGKDADPCFDYKKRLLNGRYLSVKIDLSKKKEYIMQEIDELIDDYSKYANKDSGRNTPDRVISRFLVWDEYNHSRNFKKIAEGYGCDASTVRKAYFKAFSEIMLEEYNPDKHNTKQLTKWQLQRTCDACPSRSLCEAPCPDVLAFIDQDSRGMPSIATQDRARESRPLQDEMLQGKELLAIINDVLDKEYASLDDANESLTDQDKANLKRNPRFIAYLRP